MVIQPMTTTSHTPPQTNDERRNFRNKTPGGETRLIGLRTSAMRLQTQQIDRLSEKLRNKPGVVARLEQSLAECNERLRLEIKSAEKFANRRESSARQSIARGSDSVEFRSIKKVSNTAGGNG